MGSICILLGVVVWIAMTGVGFFILNKLSSITFMGQTLAQFLKLQESSSLRLGVIGFFSALGFLIFVNLLLHGVAFNKIAAQKREIRELKKYR